ncbi:MAG: hypothetical protein HGA86_05270 [Anaerolineaceae bacterium]|nr:hypothetical protein [Anaerolineaceae bacterium]
MATTEERLKVLKMVQDGKLSADQAAELLNALDSPTQTSQRAAAVEDSSQRFSVGGRAGRWFRVRVTDTNSGKTRVNIRMPLSVVNAGLKMGMKFAPEVEGLNPQQLSELINNGELGQIVDVYDDEDGEHVEVFIE